MDISNYNWLIFIGLAVVLAILIYGVVNLAASGDKARSRSNLLMRYRVIAQFVVVILLMIGFWLKSRAN
ncbi:MAG: twin transmembrane helix small protein [Pseudomonadota bacterium]